MAQPGQPGQAHRFENGLFYLRNFDPKEYGAYQENWAAVQDERGIMYFGNNWGVLEYDGTSWRLIKTAKQTSVLALDVDSTGTVYAGLENGFGFLAPDSSGSLQFQSLEQHLPEDERDILDVWKVHATRHGVYFLTIKKLYLWTDGKMQVWPITISGLSTVINDTLYYPQWQAGINRSAGGPPELLPGTESLAMVQNYQVVPFASENTLLVSTRDSGLLKYQKGRLVPFPTPADDFLKENQIYSNANLPGGRLLIGTIRGGAVIVDGQGNILHKIDKQAGLRDNTIVAAFHNAGGALWLALLNGLARVELSTPFTRFDAGAGIETATNALIRHKGTLYAAGNRGVSALVQDESLRRGRFEAVQGLTTFAYGFISTDEALLVGTDKGVYKINGHSARRLAGYPFRVYGFHRSRVNPNRIYTALQRGLGVLEKSGGRWTDVGRTRGLDIEMTSITGDSADTIWLGSNAFGVYAMSNIRPDPDVDSVFTTETTHFSEEKGLPPGEVNVALVGENILVTSESGIFRQQGSAGDFLPDSTLGGQFTGQGVYVRSVVKDRQGRIWTCSRRDGQSQVGFVSMKLGARETDKFRRINDIGEIRTIYPEEDGIVWFGGSEGIVRYDPGSAAGTQPPFRTLVRRVLVRGDSVVYGGHRPTRTASDVDLPGLGGELRYRDNAMRFEFSATTFDDPQANQYQHWLDGFDPGWSDWTRESWKDYTNLPEGRYRFMVRARNLYHQMGSVDSFVFVIAPPWYRTWSAYLLYTVVVSAVLFFLSKLQLQRVRRRSEEALLRQQEQASLREATLRAETVEIQKEIEKEHMRGRIAGDLHDEIGSNLSSIVMISQALGKKGEFGQKGLERVRNIQTLAHQSATSMRDIVWFVNPVNESLDRLFAKMRETANLLLEPIDFSFALAEPDALPETDLDFRRNLFLIYKECLQNIVKHARAEKVQISLTCTGEHLTMTIRDDGVGFDGQQTPPGDGLRNFERRAQEMGGSIAVNTDAGSGTTVTLQVVMATAAD